MQNNNNLVFYDIPSAPPQESLHWRRLIDANNHEHKYDIGDNRVNTTSSNSNNTAIDDDKNSLIRTHQELIHAFQNDVISIRDDNNANHHQLLAEWSCIIGYCEALSTHKEASRRYSFFPIPLQALRGMVNEEFVPLLHQAKEEQARNKKQKKPIICNNATMPPSSTKEVESKHRQTVRSVANAIWKRAQNKKQGNSTNMQDELHANSLYSCLRGDIDGKSLDCFGAALLTVIGMNILGFKNSCLTLSEDHAYESHYLDGDDDDDDEEQDEDANNRNNGKDSRKLLTCEVAIPGNTLAVQSKRGQDISHTFAQLKHDHIIAETSWLYMFNNAVRCDTPCMVMAALLSNLNCDIDKQKPSPSSGGSSVERPHVVSRVLYEMKRDMLWILHDDIKTFPFALMELGECEEHLSTQRGMEWVDVSDLLNTTEETLVLRNEKLFLDAIQVSRTVYGDAQVYPYLYSGHYHRDAGRDGQEYRLVEALRLYSEATRVACTYRYDTKDCLQLMKHFTTVASLITKDILLAPRQGEDGKRAPRCWQQVETAVATTTWLVGFFDSLLFWEEKEQKMFVEVNNIQHKYFMGKIFQYLPMDIRKAAFDKIYDISHHDMLAVTDKQILHFRNPRSRRLAVSSRLIAALSTEKIIVRELDIALPSNGEGRCTRQGKRKSSG